MSQEDRPDVQASEEAGYILQRLGAEESGFVDAAALKQLFLNLDLGYAAGELDSWLRARDLDPERLGTSELCALLQEARGPSAAVGERAACTSLIVVDVQNDFCPPAGSLAVALGDTIVPRVNRLRREAEWGAVALTLDWHPADHVSFVSNHRDNPEARLFQPLRLPGGQEQMMWPAHCVQGSEGALLHPELETADADLVVKKGKDSNVDSYSAFFDNDHKTKSELEDLLQERLVTDVFVVGLAYDYCMGSTALDAKAAGFRVWVVEDCSKGVAPETTALMRHRLGLSGVRIVSSEEVPAITRALLQA